MKRNKQALLSFGEFIKEWKKWGFTVAFGNWLICFTKWFLGAKKISLVYHKQKKGEYEGGYLFLDLEEGGDFKNMRYVHFTPSAITGDIKPVNSRNVRFYFQLVGLEDNRSPLRDWGMGFKQFSRKLGAGYNKRLWGPNHFEKLTRLASLNKK